jgi:hypothetical protein
VKHWEMFALVNAASLFGELLATFYDPAKYAGVDMGGLAASARS